MSHGRRLISTIAALVASAALPAMAAETASISPPAPVVYDWSGIYAGVSAGYSFGGMDASFGPPAVSFDFDPDGFSGGVFGGVAFQADNLVYGLEGDFNFSDMSEQQLVAGVPVTSESDWFATLRGRVGYTFDRLLVYGTGGIAMGQVELSAPGGSSSSTEFGWTIGAGLEAALTDNFTVRAEYLYTDLGSRSGNVGATPFTSEFDNHTVRAGVSYRFR